jgi:hypothetical protein
MSQTECMRREIKFAGKVSKEISEGDLNKEQFFKKENENKFLKIKTKFQNKISFSN